MGLSCCSFHESTIKSLCSKLEKHANPREPNNTSKNGPPDYPMAIKSCLIGTYQLAHAFNCATKFPDVDSYCETK